ncbi:hypothetical protein D3C87_2054470 [compost metagenome]
MDAERRHRRDHHTREQRHRCPNAGDEPSKHQRRRLKRVEALSHVAVIRLVATEQAQRLDIAIGVDHPAR